MKKTCFINLFETELGNSNIKLSKQEVELVELKNEFYSTAMN